MNDFKAFDAARVDRRVRLAMRILELEQTVVPTIDDLARRVGLSSFHLAHLFNDQLGESILAYGRRIRLENAVNQMLHDRVDLNTVAATFGYASQTAFTRAFTRHFGLSPRRYSLTVAGASERHGADGHLTPLGGVGENKRLLTDQVNVVKRPPMSALARRFYGHDLAEHWRCFLAGLPEDCRSGMRLVGLSYDNAKVTPAARWRYDCAVILPAGSMTIETMPAGIDPVEIPGGLHAEVNIRGSWADLWRATIGLLTEWLPTCPELRPEGDPIPHWLENAPDAPLLHARATIRVRAKGEAPAYNMLPLSRRGTFAGVRPPAGSSSPD